MYGTRYPVPKPRTSMARFASLTLAFRKLSTIRWGTPKRSGSVILRSGSRSSDLCFSGYRSHTGSDLKVLLSAFFVYVPTPKLVVRDQHLPFFSLYFADTVPYSTLKKKDHAKKNLFTVLWIRISIHWFGCPGSGSGSRSMEIYLN